MIWQHHTGGGNAFVCVWDTRLHSDHLPDRMTRNSYEFQDFTNLFSRIVVQSGHACTWSGFDYLQIYFSRIVSKSLKLVKYESLEKYMHMHEKKLYINNQYHVHLRKQELSKNMH